MSVLVSTSRSTMARIVFAARARTTLSCLLHSPASSLVSSTTSYSLSKPSLITSRRAIHSSTRELQSPSSLNALSQESSESRPRVSATSPSTSSPPATTSNTTTAFRNTKARAQRAASLSTRKVATLTSANASIIGLHSSPPLVVAVSTNIGRYGRPIISSPLPQQSAAGTNTRTRTTNACATTKATTTSTKNPIRTTSHKAKLLRNWPKKVSVSANTLGRPVRPGSAPNDSNSVTANTTNADNRELSSSMSPQYTTAFPAFAPFTFAGRFQTGTALKQSQELEKLPFLDFRTNNSRDVMYTKCDIEADQWLNSNPSKMWALDAEWRPFTGNGKQGKMALIQLGDDKVVYLFHVIHMKKFPEALARILQDSHIFKVGINIQNDARKMFKDWGVGCASLIELGALSIQVQDDLSSQRKIRSMERLTKELLQHDVEKVPLTRMGNWESKCLSASQLEYAANDAFVTYEVAEKIKELQRTRAKQDYILPLAKVHSEGTTVVTVRGSLQERLDRPATVEDIISPVPKQTATAAKATRTGVKSPSVVTGYAKVSKNKVTMAKAKAAGLGQASKRRNVIAAAPVASSATWLARSAKPALKAKTKKSAVGSSGPSPLFSISTTTLIQSLSPTSLRTKPSYDRPALSRTPAPATTGNSYARVDPYFFFGSGTSGRSSSSNRENGGTDNMIRTIRTGSRSTVTIIPRQALKRSFSCLPSSYLKRFSTSATALADNNKSGQNDSLSRKQRGKNNRREGGVFFPSGLLPESLEGKDVLERNQSVWLEAGGRDLSEDSDVEVGVEDQDGWHLRQNQALFASLITPDPDPDLDLGVTSGSKSGSDLNLKDLESVLDKDVLFSSLRKKT